MSTEPILKELVDGAFLTPFVPRSVRRPRRRLFLSREALSDLTDQYSALNLLGVRGDVEAAMANWTSGGFVYADGDGNPRFLKRLQPPPPEIWTIRVTDPEIQVRLFCRFLKPDTLIVTRMILRGDLSKKGRKCPKKWKRAMEACEASWKQLFPQHAPLGGTVISEFVTENCDDFPI